jgi:hypothetical protein
MNFLKKIFGRQKGVPQEKMNKNPDNTRLIFLLNVFSEHGSNENYEQVVQEIQHGNSFFLLPSLNDGKDNSGDWGIIEPGQTLNLTSIYDLDGMKAIAVFTDEKALFNWAQKPTQYVAIPTTVLPDLCVQMGIVKIVINNDQKNMFVLLRNVDNFKTRTIEKATQVKVGYPAKPLSEHIIKKLIENFKNVSTIDSAYQYAQMMNGELSIVLGIRLLSESENSQIALHVAVKNALEGENLEIPVDIMIMTDSDLFEAVKKINNSLIYRR